MKIRFDNNSVSGVNRKYRGFDLNIPGHSSITVDVPPQYAKDAMTYLKHRHPAVVCTPIIPEKPTMAVATIPVKAELDEMPGAEIAPDIVNEEGEEEAALEMPDPQETGEETARETPKRKAAVTGSKGKKTTKRSGGKK